MTLSEQDHITISDCPLFRGIDAEGLLPLLGGCVSVCPAGQFLVQEGERVERLWIVLSGTLHAARFETSGREFLYQQLLPSYLAGGEIVCTPRKTCPYGIYAASDCKLWSFSWDRLEDPCLDQEVRLQMIKNLLTFVANQNIRKYYKIDALSVKGARERIMKYLTAQALRAHSNSFKILMDREAMANYLCINRSVLSHELKRMETEGLLRFRKNQFTLLGEARPANLREDHTIGLRNT